MLKLIVFGQERSINMWKLSTLVLAAILTVSTPAFSQKLPETIKKVIPSVCRVWITQTTTVIDSNGKREEPVNPFDKFLKPNQSPGEQYGIGACFVIKYKDTKYIVTNDHVVMPREDSANTKLFVSFWDTQLKRYQVKKIATDKLSDIAVVEMLETEGSRKLATVPALKWGDSDSLNQGDPVFAIGHPLGLDWSVSKGIVSYGGRRTVNTWQETIQTDVAINQGNSGGPLFNNAGEIVGVNSFILSPGQGGSVGLNFSVSSNNAKQNVQQLVEYGEVRRVRFGISYKVDYDNGFIVIEQVSKDGPSDDILKPNDILFKVNDTTLTNVNDIGKSIQPFKPGDTITVSIIRNNKLMVKEITLGSLPD